MDVECKPTSTGLPQWLSPDVWLWALTQARCSSCRIYRVHLEGVIGDLWELTVSDLREFRVGGICGVYRDFIGLRASGIIVFWGGCI